jgi:hypothetical protein
MSTPSLPERPASRMSAEGPYDPAAVARISTQADLRAIRLAFLHADIDERGGEIPTDWSAHAIMGFNSFVELDPETKTLVVTCGFLAMYVPGIDMDSLVEIPMPKDAPFELHASFRLAYQLRDLSLVEETDPGQFAATNGVLHAWPYWREIAHSTTVRMGLAPLLVGTHKLPFSGDPKPAD